jgi:hypothetical protein
MKRYAFTDIPEEENFEPETCKAFWLFLLFSMGNPDGLVCELLKNDSNERLARYDSGLLHAVSIL